MALFDKTNWHLGFHVSGARRADVRSARRTSDEPQEDAVMRMALVLALAVAIGSVANARFVRAD